MRELGRDAFPTLSNLYLAEGRTVIGYTQAEVGDRNYPELEVRWVPTPLTNGANHAQ